MKYLENWILEERSSIRERYFPKLNLHLDLGNKEDMITEDPHQSGMMTTNLLLQ